LYTSGIENTDPYLAGYYQGRPEGHLTSYGILGPDDFGGFDPQSFLPQSTAGGGVPGDGITAEVVGVVPREHELDDSSDLSPATDYDPFNLGWSKRLPAEDEEYWRTFLNQIAGGAERLEEMRNFRVPSSVTSSSDLLSQAVGSTEALTDWDVPPAIAGAYSPGGFGAGLERALADARSLGGGSFGGVPSEGLFTDLLAKIANVTGEVDELSVPDFGDLQGLADTLYGDIEGAGTAAADARARLESRGAMGAQGNVTNLITELLRNLVAAKTAAGEARVGLENIDLSGLFGGVTGAEQAALGARQGLEDLDLSGLFGDVGRAGTAALGAREGLEGLDLSGLLDDAGRAGTAALGAREGLEGLDLSGLLDDAGRAGTAALGAREGLEGLVGGDRGAMAAAFPSMIDTLREDITGAGTAALGARQGLEGLDLSGLLGDVTGAGVAAGGLRSGLEGFDLDPLLADLTGAGVAAGDLRSGLGGFNLQSLSSDLTGAGEAAGGLRQALEGYDVDALLGALDAARGAAGDLGDAAGKVLVTGEDGPTGDEDDPSPFDGEPSLNDLLSILQDVTSGMAGADPLDIEALKADPMTASLIADLQAEKIRGEEELLTKMQQLGVLRSGATVDQFERLRGDYERTRLDVLSDAAKRAETRRTEGLARGTDLADLLSRRGISIGELMGEFEGKQTLGGREADLGLLASIISSLSPDLKINKNTLAALIDTIFSGMGGTGFDPDAIEALRGMIQDQGGPGLDRGVTSVVA